jgi:hypothetical protein
LAESRRQYTAIFTVGAKLLGSFRGTMAAAQARMRALQKTAGGVFSAFKKMALGLGALGGVFAGFLAANILGKVLGMATDEAIEADQRIRVMTASFVKWGKLTEQVAAGQVKALLEISSALEKQGVLSEDVFGDMAASLASVGMWPKLIKETLGPMGDMLVQFKGVNATQEQGTEFADAWGKVIQGNQRGVLKLREFGIKLTADDMARLKNVKGLVARNKALLDIAKKYEGANKRMAETPQGKLRVFQNTLRDIAQQIGEVLLPLQADMADAWKEALPVLVPAFIGTIRLLGRTIKWAGKQLTAFRKQWETPAGVEAWNKLADAMRDLGDAFGFTLPGAQSFGTAMGNLTIQQADKTATDIHSLADSVRDLRKSLENWQEIKPMFDFMPSFNFKQDAKDLHALADAWGILQAALEGVSEGYDNIVNAVNKAADVSWRQLKKVGTAITDFVLQPFRDLYDAWQRLPTWMGGGGAGITTPTLPPQIITAPPKIPSMEPQQVFPKGAVPGAQLGGIFRRLSLLQVAERGPEAVIPLAGGARSQSLLDYATRAITGAPAGAGAGTTVTFAPVVTIHGNATETEQRAMDSRLRDLARDFITQFKAAQAQERRLSYQGGYA